MTELESLQKQVKRLVERKAKLVVALTLSCDRFSEVSRAIENEYYETAKEYCQIGIKVNRAVLKEISHE